MISEDEFFAIYDIQKLEEDVSTQDFDCGDEDLNDFLKKEVFLYKEQLLAMPYVLTKKEKIIYFSLVGKLILNLEIIVLCGGRMTVMQNAIYTLWKKNGLIIKNGKYR